MAKSKKDDGSAPAAAKSTKAAHKISPLGQQIINAISIAAADAARNGYQGVAGLTPMTVVKGEKVVKGVTNSASKFKNEGNKIKNKLTFNETTGEAKASISKLLAGPADSDQFKKFLSLAKAAKGDLGKTYSPAVKALAAEAVAYGGGGGGTRAGRTGDSLDLL